MFHLYITLAYIIPNIYMFFRMMYLFIGKGYRLLYSFIYLLIASIYPVSEFFSHQIDISSFAQMISNFSGYILPFFLYLFLATLLFDLLLLFNLIFRFFKPETRKKFRFRLYALSSLILLSVTVVVAGAINLNTMRISRYSIEVPKKEAKINRLKIVFVADMHLDQNTSKKYIQKFVRKVNSLKPDLMLFGGDIVEGFRVKKIDDNIRQALQKIQAKYGVYGVYGNHDFSGGSERKRFFSQAGIKMLCDTFVVIDNSVYLAGRYDPRFGERKSVKEIMNGTSDLPVILLDHRPNHLDEISKTPVAIQFSGHSHNGQMFPINIITNNVYELSWGYRKIRNTYFFVTSGLRLWGPPVKTAGKSEIMLVDVVFK